MKIIGINGGFAQPPSFGPDRRHVNDGSAALLVDGDIMCATIEERHTRRRYGGGFRRGANACLNSARLKWTDLDAIGFSTCCDVQWQHEDDVLEELEVTYRDDELWGRVRWSALLGKVVVVDHHESHAMLAFVGAGVERALVAVIDGMGNRLAYGRGGEWWRGAFQRQSYYLASWVGDRVRLELIDEDCAGPEEIGIGEVYRAMTHFLGWDSYQYAGKTMALAALGNPHRWPKLKFCEVRSGRIVTLMENDHDNPLKQVEGVLYRADVVLSMDGAGRPQELPPQEQRDLAACLQAQVEAVVVECLTGLCDRYAVPALCVSGGVAMNCLAMGRLARERPDLRIYVPPAPSDTGQGLGNALWVAFNERSPFRERATALCRTGIQTAALGPEYEAARFSEAVSLLSTDPEVSLSGPYENDDLARAVADLIERGLVVGVRQGRAEYGPRAFVHPLMNRCWRHLNLRSQLRHFRGQLRQRGLGITPHPEGDQGQKEVARNFRGALDKAGPTGGSFDVVGGKELC